MDSMDNISSLPANFQTQILEKLDIESALKIKSTCKAARHAFEHLPLCTRAILTGEDIFLNGKEIKASYLMGLLKLRVRQCLFPEESHLPTSSLELETLPLLLNKIEKRITSINTGDKAQYRQIFVSACINGLPNLFQMLIPMIES